MVMKYKCMKCDEPAFDNEDDLGIHLLCGHGYGEEIIINGETKFKCTLCDEIYDYESDLYMDLMWSHDLAMEIPEEQQ